MSLPALESIPEIALETSPNGVVVCDEAGTIVLVNKQIEAIFGYSRDELLGTGIDLLLPESRRGMHAADRRRFWKIPAARPMGTGRELSGRRKDGSEVAVEVGLATTVAEGRMLAIASVADVSERRRLLKQQAAELARRLAFEGQAVQVAARFVNVPAEGMDDAITASLREIALVLDLGRGALWQFAEGASDLRCTHAWTRPEFQPPPPRSTRRRCSRGWFRRCGRTRRSGTPVWRTRRRGSTARI